MSERQLYYSPTSMKEVESAREYEEYRLAPVSINMGDFGGYAIRVLYVDEQTGICVRDIEKFENWIGRVHA